VQNFANKTIKRSRSNDSRLYMLKKFIIESKTCWFEKKIAPLPNFTYAYIHNL